MSPKPLTYRAIARFGAANGLDMDTTLKLIKSMGPEARAAIARVHASDLCDEEKLAAKSLEIRFKLRDMAEEIEMRALTANAPTCPHAEGSDSWYDWHALQFDRGQRWCQCCGRNGPEN